MNELTICLLALCLSKLYELDARGIPDTDPGRRALTRFFSIAWTIVAIAAVIIGILT